MILVLIPTTAAQFWNEIIFRYLFFCLICSIHYDPKVLLDTYIVLFLYKGSVNDLGYFESLSSFTKTNIVSFVLRDSKWAHSKVNAETVYFPALMSVMSFEMIYTWCMFSNFSRQTNYLLVSHLLDSFWFQSDEAMD